MFLKQFQLYKKNLHGRSEKLYLNLFFTLFLGALIFGGDYIRREICVSDQGTLYLGGLYLEFYGISIEVVETIKGAVSCCYQKKVFEKLYSASVSVHQLFRISTSYKFLFKIKDSYILKILMKLLFRILTQFAYEVFRTPAIKKP